MCSMACYSSLNFYHQWQERANSGIHYTTNINIISPLLTKFYNMFMQKATFPNIFKVAKVASIYIKERPGSMLPIFGKLF